MAKNPLGRTGLARRFQRATILINGVVREVPIGPHTVARFFVQPEREEHFECALCGLLTATNLQRILGFPLCQGHGPKERP